MRTLCRLWIFGVLPVKTPRGKPQLVAWQDWNEDGRMERRMARLPGSGSFYWPSRRAAWRRAQVMSQRGAIQVKVETISGREVGRLWASQRRKP